MPCVICRASSAVRHLLHGLVPGLVQDTPRPNRRIMPKYRIIRCLVPARPGAAHRPLHAMSPPMPPALLLQDISLTFGTTPLLSGAGPGRRAGDRVCLVGRNGSGKSTLLRIAAGLVPPDCRPPLRPAGRHHPLSAAGARPVRLPHHARLCRGRPGHRGRRRPPPRPLPAGATRPDRRRTPRHPVRRRGPPCRARPRPGPLARHPAARRADQPPGPARHRVAGAGAGGDARRASC